MYCVKELRDTTSQLPTLHIAAASTRSHRNWTAPILAFSSHDAKIKSLSSMAYPKQDEDTGAWMMPAN